MSVFLSALTFVCVLPMQAFATEYQNYKTLTTFDAAEDEDLIIKDEVIEERTANSKTYLL